MNLYLLRHSNAEDLPPQGESGDRLRRLTAAGREKARRIGAAMARLDLGIDLILTSPATRARETAAEVLAKLDPQPPLEECEGLWIGGDFRPVAARLRREWKRLGNVLLVGHEPDLGRLASQWLTGGPDLRLIFKKGGLCKLSVSRLTAARCATLEWHLTAKQLGIMADRR